MFDSLRLWLFSFIVFVFLYVLAYLWYVLFLGTWLAYVTSHVHVYDWNISKSYLFVPLKKMKFPSRIEASS